MATVTLLAKAYSGSQSKTVFDLLKGSLEGLKVKIENVKATSRGWIQLTISGEDEKMALNYLSAEFGLAPESPESVTKFSTIKGRIAWLDKETGDVRVDIGVFSPQTVYATVSLPTLQAQLVDGKELASTKIIELFGLCKDMPVTIKVLEAYEEAGSTDAMFAEEQLSQYHKWTVSLLDRLIVLGASGEYVESVLKKEGCYRDIVSIEKLGLFEQAIVCKLGTDAVGLIPKIGKRLRYASFSVFSPRRILKSLGYDSPWFSS